MEQTHRIKFNKNIRISNPCLGVNVRWLRMGELGHVVPHGYMLLLFPYPSIFKKQRGPHVSKLRRNWNRENSWLTPARTRTRARYRTTVFGLQCFLFRESSMKEQASSTHPQLMLVRRVLVGTECFMMPTWI